MGLFGNYNRIQIGNKYELMYIYYNYHKITMSISLNTNLNLVGQGIQGHDEGRITADILSLFSEPSLQGKVVVIGFNFDTIEIAFIKLKVFVD